MSHYAASIGTFCQNNNLFHALSSLQCLPATKHWSFLIDERAIKFDVIFWVSSLAHFLIPYVSYPKIK